MATLARQRSMTVVRKIRRAALPAADAAATDVYLDRAAAGTTDDGSADLG